MLATPTATTAACPLCGCHATRQHSRYTRILADLPCQGRIASLQVQARRFRCDNPRCPRRIFAERLPEVAPARARRTMRLADSQRRIGLALGGQAGARLATQLAMPVSGETLLRLIRVVTVEPPGGLAKGIARDLDAVRAGIVERWSTSPVEGQINRLKTIKRQMYGRAGHDLLRARMLAAA